jgi:5,10-methylenetetrahydrofolate reductase
MLEKKGVLALEVDPPRDSDFDKILKHLEPFAKNVDAFNVADSPMARPRMSPISTGKLLKENLGKEIIVHYTCRDRNILGIQSDLLGASAMGLDNFLALGGDPPSIGDYPFATGVYDLTSEGLVEMMSALNTGRDILGNPVGKQTHFFIGVGMGIGFEEDQEIEKAKIKLQKGAHYIITQPIFDVDASCLTLQSFQKKGILVIPSVLPLVSFRNAEYLHYEVPGIVIPEDLRRRMEQKKGKEAEKEGAAIAREILAQLKPCSNGILLMPPLGKFYLLEDLLS